jgi:hypothetical protein
MSVEQWWSDIDNGKTETLGKKEPCPSATLSTTNLTWTDLESKAGHHGERSATNRLTHGTAY